jgi:hypothetical protein
VQKVPSWVVAAAKGLFAASLIAWLIHRGALDLGAIGGAFSRHWLLVLAVALLFVAQTLLIALRWQTLLSAHLAGVKFGKVFSLTMIGLLFNVVSPGAVGGDLIKGYYVHQQARSHRAEAVTTIVLDRVVGLLGLFLVAAFTALPNLFSVSENARLRTLALAAVAAAVLGLGSLAVAIGLSPATASRKRRNSAISFLLRAFESLTPYKDRPGVLLRSIALSMVVWMLGCAAFYAAALAAGAPAFPKGLLFLVPLGFLATALPVSPGGIGVGQVAFAELFRIASNGAYDFGANAYTVFQAVQILGSLCGFVFYLAQRQEIRAMTESAAPPAEAD